MKITSKLALALLAAGMWGCTKPAPPAGTASPNAPGTPVAVSTSAPATTASPAAAGLPDGWAAHKSKDGKLSLGLPSDWVVANGNDPKFKAVLKDLIKSNPGLAAAESSSYYFMALAPKAIEGFTDNVNVVQKALPQQIPVNDETAAAIKAELAKALPVQGELTMTVEDFPIGKAFHYEATLDFKKPGGGGSFQTYAIGYMLMQGTDLYTVTYSTNPKRAESFRDLAKQSMSTFKLD